MGESLEADPNAMRGSSSKLVQLAAEASRMVSELAADLAQEGEFWGDDEPGRMIAESYVPGAERGMEGMQNLVSALRAMQDRISGAADTFDGLDMVGAQRIAAAVDPNPVGTFPDATPTRAYSDPAPAPVFPSVTPSVPPAPRSTPTPAVASGSGEPFRADAPAAPATAGRPPAVDQRPDSTTDPGVGEPDAAAGDNPALTAAEPGRSFARDTSGGAAAAANPAAANSPLSGESRPAAVPPTGRSGGPARTVAGPAAAASRPGNSGNSPWSRPPLGSPAAPGAGTSAPRVASPRTRDRPGRVAEPGRARKTAPRKEVSRAVPTGSAAMQVASEMAARHLLELRGFEAAGLHEHTVREMAAALDDVLGRYPFGLRGIEISDLSGPAYRVENRAATDGSGDPIPWLVLDSAARTEPRPPTADRPTDHPAQRPMYLTVVHGLGGVLDLSGGFRARGQAQRSLITEYLRLRGGEGDTLSGVVSGYKRWRGELGDNCFHRGVFAPAPALADAFAAVELDPAAAGGPAEVLHRLLVVLAEQPAPS